MKNIFLLLSLIAAFSTLAQQKSDVNLNSPLVPQQNINILPLSSPGSSSLEKGSNDHDINWHLGLQNRNRVIENKVDGLGAVAGFNKVNQQFFNMPLNNHNVRLIQWNGNISRSISSSALSLTDYNKIEQRRKMLMTNQIKMPYSSTNKIILPLRFTPDNRQMSAGLEALLEVSSLILDLYIDNNTQSRMINNRN